MRQAAGRNALQVQARAVLEPAAWTTVGYLLGATPGLVATSFSAEYGRPALLPVLAQVACICAVTIIGQVAGSRLPWYLGAPICALAVYLLLGFLSFNADSILLAMTPIDERRVTFQPVLAWVLGLQTVFWLTVALHVLMRRVGAKRVSSAALIAAGLVATPLLAITPETRGVDLAATELRCEVTSGAPAGETDSPAGTKSLASSLCLPRGKEIVRKQLGPELHLATNLLAGLLPKVTYVDDEAAGISAEVNRDIEEITSREEALDADVVSLSQASDISAYAYLDTDQVHYGLVAYFIPRVASTASGDGAERGSEVADLRPLASPTDVLWRWYLTEAGAKTDGSGPFGGPTLDPRFLNYDSHESDLAFFSDLDADARADWFHEHADQIRTGSLTWEAFEH
ncbi:hypothetical protein [Nocardioides lacusdianchii]|uniref:hypothetical protein n=1 Tax=Nocardioides lacusdianchii TaxID=2783664 RepID=UPI001CCA9C2C|nr:hypothetical protein [Nocardioides lacusdianchii]